MRRGICCFVNKLSLVLVVKQQGWSCLWCKSVQTHTFLLHARKQKNIGNLLLMMMMTMMNKNPAFLVETIWLVILTFVFVLQLHKHLNCVITLVVQLLLLCNAGSSVQVVVLGDQTKGDICILYLNILQGAVKVFIKGKHCLLWKMNKAGVAQQNCGGTKVQTS